MSIKIKMTQMICKIKPFCQGESRRSQRGPSIWWALLIVSLMSRIVRGHRFDGFEQTNPETKISSTTQSSSSFLEDL